jgi:hypothetical protein
MRLAALAAAVLKLAAPEEDDRPDPEVMST